MGAPTPLANAILNSTGIPVVWPLGDAGISGKSCPRMKNKSSRFIFGVLSSLLFAVGLSRAASVVEPLAGSLADASSKSVIAGAPDCSTYCDLAGAPDCSTYCDLAGGADCSTYCDVMDNKS